MTAFNEYGKALFLLAEEEGTLDATFEDVKIASRVFSENPDYLKALGTPAITKEEKIRMVDEAFYPLSEHLKSLIKILVEKRLTYYCAEVFSTFISLYEEKMGILNVEAVTAIPLSKSQNEALRTKLAGITGKTIIIKNTVNPEILGGMKLRYLGIQIDGSVKNRLDSFSESLKNIVI